MNYQNEYENERDCASVKYKGEKHPSEATEYSKKRGKVPNNLN